MVFFYYNKTGWDSIAVAPITITPLKDILIDLNKSSPHYFPVRDVSIHSPKISKKFDEDKLLGVTEVQLRSVNNTTIESSTKHEGINANDSLLRKLNNTKVVHISGINSIPSENLSSRQVINQTNIENHSTTIIILSKDIQTTTMDNNIFSKSSHPLFSDTPLTTKLNLASSSWFEFMKLNMKPLSKKLNHLFKYPKSLNKFRCSSKILNRLSATLSHENFTWCSWALNPTGGQAIVSYCALIYYIKCFLS